MTPEDEFTPLSSPTIWPMFTLSENEIEEEWFYCWPGKPPKMTRREKAGIVRELREYVDRCVDKYWYETIQAVVGNAADTRRQKRRRRHTGVSRRCQNAERDNDN